MFDRLTHLLAPALAVAALALMPAAALASPEDVIADCVEDGDLDRSYSNADRQAAAEQLPSDADSYTDCRSIIEGSVPTAGIAGRPGGFPGGDGTADRNRNGVPDSEESGAAAEELALAQARERELARAETEARLGDRGFDPGTVGAIDGGETANGLPLPVLLALIALALLLMAGAVLALGRRRPAFVSAALRRVPRRRR